MLEMILTIIQVILCLIIMVRGIKTGMLSVWRQDYVS